MVPGLFAVGRTSLADVGRRYSRWIFGLIYYKFIKILFQKRQYPFHSAKI